MMLQDHELRTENQLLEKFLRQKVIELPPNQSQNTIPIDFKLQIAIGELSQINNEVETRKEEANKSISTLKVMLSETEIRIQDIQRDAHNFQQDVVNEGGRCGNAKGYQAEKFVRHMKRRILDQESALDKLKLKNCTLISRKRKLEAQLNREEATSFHFIDYHQMQIRQKQNKKLLATQTSKVALRKIALKKTQQKTESLQGQLDELNTKSKLIKRGIAMREAHMERLDESVYSKEDEVDGLKNVLKNKASPDQIMEEEPTGPDIMAYIQTKAQIYELREKIKAMERRAEISKGGTKIKQQKERKKQIPRKKDPEPRITRWTGRHLGLDGRPISQARR